MANILIVASAFPPAYLAGGPTRSLGALTYRLSAHFDFWVLASAFDVTVPLSGIERRSWFEQSGARVWYTSRHPGPLEFRRALKDSRADLIYLNSFFDPFYTLIPLLTARVISRRTPILMAPRGEMSPGARALKRRRKSAYIAIFKFLRLHRVVTWHASNEGERVEIEAVMSPRRRAAAPSLDVRVARNLASVEPAPDRSETSEPGADGCDIVFLSRVARMKNLHALIEALAHLPPDTRLTIAGPLDDPTYGEECVRLVDALNLSDRVTWHGAVPADDVVDFLSRYELFALPTLGENFGHVILEALCAGVPVIVGRDTPWAPVEQAGAGWVCDPTDVAGLAERIGRFRSLDADERNAMRRAAKRMAGELVNDPSAIADNVGLLSDCIAEASS